jgi:glutaredoxin
MMILFHTDSSEKSNEALEILDTFHKKNTSTAIFRVNASKVNDIHPLFGINSVPTLVVLKKDRQPETILGIQTEESYKRIVNNGHHNVVHRKGGEQSMRVSVYSSDGCPWCHDENAAKDIFRRSGQMGTPQIDINGQIIVGFDQPKIDKLLGLN